MTILVITFYGLAGLYPAMLPSSLDAAFSITVHDAASSTTTLTIMLVVTLLFLPVVVTYQIWVVRLFGDRLTQEELQSYGTHYRIGSTSLWSLVSPILFVVQSLLCC